MDASSRSALSRGVASFRVFLNSASSERSQRRTRRVLAVLACTLCGFQSYAAYAQATAAPTPVPPIPVDPSLLYNHPAVFEPGQPPLPIFPGRAVPARSRLLQVYRPQSAARPDPFPCRRLEPPPTPSRSGILRACAVLSPISRSF